MAFIAAKSIKFGDGWKQPGEEVPQENGRNYGAMLRRGEIVLVAEADKVLKGLHGTLTGDKAPKQSQRKPASPARAKKTEHPDMPQKLSDPEGPPGPSKPVSPTGVENPAQPKDRK